jgi:hypothetical protein
MGRHKLIDEDGKATLTRLYCDDRLSIYAIAQVTGRAKSSVHRYLQEAGVIARDLSTATELGLKRKPRPKGQLHPNFRHGRNNRGYLQQCQDGTQRLQHRVEAERVLGRPLLPQEVVHHCNEDKTDNRPENLWVFPSQSAHTAYHKSRGRITHPDTIFLKDHCS